MMERRLPSYFDKHPDEIPESRAADDGDNTKADGANLGLGSAEYREMMYDRQGLDEFEQREMRLSDAQLRQREVVQEGDVWHDTRATRLASEPQVRSEAREAKDSERLSTTERNVQNQVRKLSVERAVMERARDMADATETASDDVQVERRMPSILEEQVYDEGTTYDDFYPGAKTLNKYM